MTVASNGKSQSHGRSKKMRPPFPLARKFPSKLERWTYRTFNGIENRLWPFRPSVFSSSLIAITAYNIRVPTNFLMQSIPSFDNKYLKIVKTLAVSFGVTYIPVFIVRQLLCYVYFSYKGFLFEDPKKPSLKTKIWGIFRKFLSFVSPPQLESCDRLLPRMPVPKLEDTVEKYLQSIEHTMNKDEYNIVKEQAEQFLKEEGPRIQRYTKLYSLLVDNYVTPFWVKYAYLYGRSPLLINSSVGHGDLFEDAPATWAYRAAHIVYIEYMSHLAIDKQQYKPLGEGLVCSRHYQNMYAVTRIPGEEIDYRDDYGISKYVIVAFEGRLYRIDMCDENNMLYSIDDLSKIFYELLNRGLTPIEDARGKIPALTHDKRDQWARNRKKFFLENETNKKALAEIEAAVIFISLDKEDYGHDSQKPEKLSHFLLNMLTGDGTNRWVDKSLNYVISQNARAGGTTEHSIADGAEFDHILENFVFLDTEYLEYPPIEEQKQIEKIDESDKNKLKLSRELEFDVNDEMASEIDRCYEAHLKQKDDLDLASLIFTEFGKGLIKKCGVSPDAFIQMAIQLANYRDQGKFVLTYEPASVRFFRDSRTETLRTVSQYSVNFVYAMFNENATVRN
ncbi:hypothetical protein WR25_05409 isoform B [Diploscapter pachys]|uniref:Choline/carnitine acyltransferase domain-containing protein n=2 Tax=Diploscapter pachys TaxID=2018661 RepID=A0A2A2KA56_9BILA|nr:hypothetical protein WR25_05409 isoform B [Diploscapter pachys]